MQEWSITLLSLAVSTIVTTIIGYLIKRSFDKYFNRKQTQDDERKKQLQEAGKVLDANRDRELREIIREEFKIQVAELNTTVEGINTEVKKLQESADLNANATKCLLRDRILQIYYQCVTKGYKTSKEDENINHFYEAYKSLNGNSYVEECYEALKKLPIQEAPTSANILPNKKKGK